MANPNRIAKEVEDVRRDSHAGITVTRDESDPNHITGTLRGPEGTPYEGGLFIVDIVIPKDYPFTPPKMKFKTKLWHPNVSSQTGAICLDILKDQWSPALTIKTTLLSLQALMCTPEPSDPQDAEVATMYTRNNAKFREVAAFWTECFAVDTNAKDRKVNPAVLRLMDMGFSEEASRAALSSSKLDENAAVEALLSSMG